MSRRAKCCLRNGSHASASSSSTVITTVVPRLTAVLTPITPPDNLTKSNKHSLSAYLEHLAPSQLKEVRHNWLRNNLVPDTVSVLAVEALLRVAFICDIPVRPYIPHVENLL